MRPPLIWNDGIGRVRERFDNKEAPFDVLFEIKVSIAWILI